MINFRKEQFKKLREMQAPEIKKINAMLKKLERNKEQTLDKLQNECAHENVVECTEFSGAPKRLCLYCGLEEDGWGCGYKKLRDIGEDAKVDMNMFLSLRY